MALPWEVYVIEGEWAQIDPTKGNNFCECESRLNMFDV